MLKRYMAKSLFFIFLSGTFLSLSSYKNSNSSNPTTENIKPGVSDDSGRSRDDQKTNREELAYEDYRESRNYDNPGVRMGDWDFKENWRYHRAEFLRGETQPQVYRENHPYGPGGIGYDADESYLRLERDDARARNYSNNAKQRIDNRDNNSEIGYNPNANANYYDNPEGNYDSYESQGRRGSRYDRKDNRSSRNSR